MPRPRHPLEIEARFRRPITPAVEHRLPALQQACLEEALTQARASHQSVHEASRILGEALEHQLDLRRPAREQLRQVIAAAALALEALE